MLQKEYQALWDICFTSYLVGIHYVLVTGNGTENTAVDWTHIHMNMHTMYSCTHTDTLTHPYFLDVEPIGERKRKEKISELIGQIAI